MSGTSDVLDRTAILVLGHQRPKHLGHVLESLRRQDALSMTDVWIDGHQGRKDFEDRSESSVQVAREYAPAGLELLDGHIGIEKLMLDALMVLSRKWEALIVLEDDCFPTRHAVEEFASSLASVRDREDIFSVYGHHYLMPGEDQPFSRFQGWGWAAWTARLAPILEEARRLFMMPELEFIPWVKRNLTPEVRARIAVTPGRNPGVVLERFFCWDACFALLTAQRGLLHQRTARRVIYNCGLGEGGMHFESGDGYRRPPYNMIGPDEVWDYF